MKNVKKIFSQNRKGIVDVQFNWIFVLITGVIIFMFIIGIVLSQKRNADNQVGISTVKQITTILKARQQSANVYSEITFPKTTINFQCQPDRNLFTFKIENTDRADLPLDIIFGPQDIATTKMLVWGQKFAVGFPVSTFTYITTPDSIIILYGDPITDPATATPEDILLDELYYGLPSNITKRITTNLVAFGGYKRTKIVCIKDHCPPNNNNYVSIDPYLSSLEYGNVTFHKKGSAVSNDITRPYFTKSGLYGAIFSDNADYYTCQMSRAMSQLEIKRALVQTRLELINNDVGYGSVCQNIITATLNDQVIPMTDAKFDWESIAQRSIDIRNLELRNEDLRMKSCPNIY